MSRTHLAALFWFAVVFVAVWILGDRWLYLTDGWEGTKDTFTFTGKALVFVVLSGGGVGTGWVLLRMADWLLHRP